MKLMFHDDNCGELLDEDGRCPRCCFPPDMQSIGIRVVPVNERSSSRSYLAAGRQPIPAAKIEAESIPRGSPWERGEPNPIDVVLGNAAPTEPLPLSKPLKRLGAKDSLIDYVERWKNLTHNDKLSPAQQPCGNCIHPHTWILTQMRHGACQHDCGCTEYTVHPIVAEWRAPLEAARERCSQELIYKSRSADMVKAIDDLRAAGWSVAVHNDYRLGDAFHTFWLFTNPNGRWIKGEGTSDAEAIAQAVAATKVATPAAGERLSPASVSTLLGHLNDVQRDLARGVNSEDDEPDQHRAVRLAAYEIERARAREEELGDLANRTYYLLCAKFTDDRGGKGHDGHWNDDEACELTLEINEALTRLTTTTPPTTILGRGQTVRVKAGVFKGKTGILVVKTVGELGDKWIVRLDKPWIREGSDERYQELVFPAAELEVIPR